MIAADQFGDQGDKTRIRAVGAPGSGVKDFPYEGDELRKKEEELWDAVKRLDVERVRALAHPKIVNCTVRILKSPLLPQVFQTSIFAKFCKRNIFLFCHSF